MAFCAALLLFPGTALAQPSALLSFTTTDSSSASGASIRLTWSYPSNGNPFNHYEYRVSTDGGAVWNPDWTVVPGSDTSTIQFNLTGLTYGIEYTFQLRAVAATPGIADVPGPAAPATGTPLRPAPTNLKAYLYSGRVDLEWDTNSQVTEYRVDTEVTSTNALHASSRISAGLGPLTTTTILNLTNGTGYTFTVVAVQGTLDTSEPSSVNATLGAGVTVWPPSLTVPEGGSAGYTVTLDTQPTDSVTITVDESKPANDPDLTADPETLVFTRLNWDTPQTVTVSAAEDDDGEAGIAQFLHDVVSDDIGYDGIGVGGVRLTEADNDSIEVTVSPTTLSVPEGGSATYTVRLGTKPLYDVTVEATRDQRSDDDLTVSSDTDTDMDMDTDSVTLIFTDSNWNMEQTVTVSAAEDDADELDGVAIFSHGTASFDDDYYPLDVDSVTATEADNDSIGVMVSPTTLSVSEGGSATYTVRLGTKPLSDVTVEATRDRGSDDDLTVSSDTDTDMDTDSVTLTFTDSNWNMEQTVTVSAAEDDADELDGVAIFSHGTASNDDDYFPLNVDSVTATEADNDKDQTRPSVEITTEASAPVGGAFEVTIAFSEAVTGFEQSEITVTNGSVTGFNGSGTSYTAEITPSASGEVTVAVGEDVAEDGAGNGNQAAEPFIIETDLTPPEVEITREATVPVVDAFEVTITFSEPVEGFESEEIEVTNGTVVVADFTEVSSSEYRATIKPKQLGQPVVVEVAEEVAEDAAGNGNRAAEPFEVETKLVVSYEEESYTATEGGDPIAVTVKLSQGWAEQLAIPIQVRRPETTELDDYTVEGLAEWDAQEGSGTLSFAAEELEQTFTITADHDGDGDDETVELGFGELPEIVMAGEPSVATVTLEDKGLVELEVSFGQAAYEVKEGQGVDIEMMVSPAADRRVEVPLVVALVGGTTPEDYSGVPALVVFEEGESEGTISVELLADEVNDPGEGIMLSLGELPEAVIAGDPSSTEVHFIQYRTAEQFSQSLEVMLAVMARSMGESAQTAIEGRFERYRQWSRMRTTGSTVAASSAATGAMTRGRAAASTYRGAGVGRGESLGIGLEGLDGFVSRGPEEPGVGDAAESRAQPETGSSGNYERPQREPWRSWLPGLSLSSLGRVAGFGQADMRASSGYGMAPRGGVHGQERSYGPEVAEASPRAGSSESSGTRAQGLNLSGVSVEMPLAEQEASKGWVPVLWAQGDLQSFDGELRRIGMNYRGGLDAAHVGVDFYINVKMLAGLSYMRSWGDLDYTDDGVDGVLESRINSVHPYLYWQPKEGFSTWVIGGWGAGQVEVREPGRDHDFDADFRMLAGGTRAVLRRRGNSEWGLRADAFTAQLGTAALEDLGKVSGEAHRARFMVEWVHDRALSEGRSLSLKAEVGERFDGGDAELGSGLESGFRLGYVDGKYGVDVALQGRVLLVHTSDYRDWGLGLQASWDPGEKGRGIRASVSSSRGRDGGGRTTLWDNPDAVTRPLGMGSLGMSWQSRMGGEVAYAGLEVPGIRGQLTPYSRVRWTGEGRELAWGTAWSLSAGEQLAQPATVELEGMSRESRSGEPDHGLLLRMSIPF